jgi:hypothetical protein
MNKINRSIKLLKTAFAILLREKKLLLFPFIGTGLAFVVMLFFVAPVALYPTGHPYFSVAHWSAIGERISQTFSTPPEQLKQFSDHPALTGFTNGLTGGGHLIFRHWWITLFFAVSYFASMFLATFCNVAFYHEIMQALNGNTVSIRRGFQFAKTRWQTVLMWSLFAGLVGCIIQAIEQRIGFFGKIIAGFIGFAWSVACIFIIPTLVRDTETKNPLELLRHSAGTLKRTWGETVIGFVSVELISLVSIVVVIASSLFMLLGLPIFMISHHEDHISHWEMIMIIGVLPLVNSVYRCALFIYATEGVIPEPFNKGLLDSAWKVK